MFFRRIEKENLQNVKKGYLRDAKAWEKSASMTEETASTDVTKQLYTEEQYKALIDDMRLASKICSNMAKLLDEKTGREQLSPAERKLVALYGGQLEEVERKILRLKNDDEE